MKYLLAAINAKYIHSSPAVWLLQGSVPESCRSLVQIDQVRFSCFNKFRIQIGAKQVNAHKSGS